MCTAIHGVACEHVLQNLVPVLSQFYGGKGRRATVVKARPVMMYICLYMHMYAAHTC